MHIPVCCLCARCIRVGTHVDTARTFRHDLSTYHAFSFCRVVATYLYVTALLAFDTFYVCPPFQVWYSWIHYKAFGQPAI